MKPIARLVPVLLVVVAAAVSGCSRNCATCGPTPPTGLPNECGNANDATFERISRALANSGDEAPRVLMLSGGGSFGAWGAGVLNGWSERAGGNRPKFQLVTGSSTGAILGTWAFLGSGADGSAKCAYKNTADRDVYEPALEGWLWLEPWRWGKTKPWVSLKNLGPLRTLFRRYTTMDQVKQVGLVSRNEGRVFLTGTVDLDLGAFCIWDMGKLAEDVLDAGADKKKAQAAYDRYMEVVMASSSNPGVFNPTFLPSKIDGDMHVDGGVRHQIFFLPRVTDAIAEGIRRWQSSAKKPHAVPKSPAFVSSGRATTDSCNISDDGAKPRIYAVVNVPSVVPRLCTKENIYDIAQRSLTVLMIQSLIGDLHQAREQWNSLIGGKPAGDFCVSRIPDTIETWPFADDFPECQMRALYEAGRTKAASAAPWDGNIPPGGPSPNPCDNSPASPPPTCRKPEPGCG